MNEGVRQETASGSEGMGQEHRGAEQLKKTRNGNGNYAQRRDN